VEYVEDDGTMWTMAAVPSKQQKQDKPPSWGLPRVSERKLDLTKPYVYPDSAGDGVKVYVVDTGVQDTQSDFGGRAKLIKSFVTGEANTDMNGHGTHCSGTIASKTYGVAKKVSLFGVKVLNGQGSGQYSDVIAGINYVTGLAKVGKTVMSMSLGGPKSQAVDDAIVAAIKAGVVAVVAAGNDGGDACQGSPSGAPGVLAVGATDNTDTIANFSNKGKCVGIFGPGVDITSLWKGADGATNKISGTSMAPPPRRRCRGVADVAEVVLHRERGVRRVEELRHQGGREGPGFHQSEPVVEQQRGRTDHLSSFRGSGMCMCVCVLACTVYVVSVGMM